MTDSAVDQEKPLTDGNARGWPILQRALAFYRSVGASYYGRRAETLLAASA